MNTNVEIYLKGTNMFNIGIAKSPRDEIPFSDKWHTGPLGPQYLDMPSSVQLTKICQGVSKTNTSE